ncbi:hypothetical protein MT390_13960 [Vibrio sp. 2-Bac 85]
MDLILLANLFVSSISSISSVVLAYNSSTMTDAKIKKAKTRIDTPLRIGGAKVSQLIDSKLLGILSSKAEQEARELIIAISKTDDVELIKQLIDEATNRLCFYLQQIKQYNNDELPTERLKKLWLSHGCKEICNV